LLITAMAIGVAAAADPPDVINYQGVLRDDLDQPLDGTYAMVFRLFTEQTAGTEVLCDSQAVVVSGGLFAVRIGEIARVQEITFARPAVLSPARPRDLPPTAGGEIRFEQVTFGYPEGGERSQLDQVDLHVPAGAGVGVIGPSGIGKTTLIDLLARHYDPVAGRILLDGVDLRELDLGELRDKIAVIAQDTALLPGSIAENIRYARPEATDDEVQEAARRAQVACFAEALPAGLDTQVGSRGLALSGGQRQRIAIARAMLLEPLVLVLDEATSSVDRQTETQIIEAVHDLFAGRTRIVVSHRRETLAGLDAVFALSGAALVPLGDGQNDVGRP